MWIFDRILSILGKSDLVKLTREEDIHYEPYRAQHAKQLDQAIRQMTKEEQEDPSSISAPRIHEIVADAGIDYRSFKLTLDTIEHLRDEGDPPSWLARDIVKSCVLGILVRRLPA